MAAAVVLFIIQPVAKGLHASLEREEDELTETEARKRVALLALRDVEYDFLAGKLDENDYRSLKGELTAEALAALEADEKAARAGRRPRWTPRRSRRRSRRPASASRRGCLLPGLRLRQRAREAGSAPRAAMPSRPGRAADAPPPVEASTAPAPARPAGSSPVLSARGLTREYGAVVAVDGIDLELGPGDFLTVFGPNGAGKTSLLSLLGGGFARRRARSWVGGQRLDFGETSWRSRIGVLSHQGFLYAHLTVAENLRFFGRLFGLRTWTSASRAPGAGGARRPGRLPGPPALPRDAPAARRWPGRSSTTPSWCSWTSRTPGSTRTRPPCCATCSSPSRTDGAPWSW